MKYIIKDFIKYIHLYYNFNDNIYNLIPDMAHLHFTLTSKSTNKTTLNCQN